MSVKRITPMAELGSESKSVLSKIEVHSNSAQFLPEIRGSRFATNTSNSGRPIPLMNRFADSASATKLSSVRDLQETPSKQMSMYDRLYNR